MDEGTIFMTNPELRRFLYRINDLEAAIKQIEQISLEKMKFSEDETWKTVNEIAVKALWPI